MRGWLLIALLAWPLIGQPQPYTPNDDQTVLVDVPAAAVSLRRSRSKPIPLVQARPMARLLLEQYRRSTDPRQLGRAQALLQPWLEAETVDAATALLGAQLAQASHDFAAAQQYLQHALDSQPEYPQAWLEMANIQRVQGQFAQAADACVQLHDYADTFVAQVCTFSMASLQGDLDAAWAQLDGLRSALPMQPKQLQQWYWTEWVDLALRRADTPSLRQTWPAIRAQHDNAPLLGLQYLDWLLSQQKWEDVIALTSEHGSHPGLQLRHFLALQATQHADAAAQAQQLSQLWKALKTRPATERHGREEARFWLAVGQPQAALEAARQHWQTQREAEDTLIFARAAIAAEDPEAQSQLRNWLRDSGYQDRRLPPQAQAE
jgi:lipopolysaccharide biosynthesis regulator YciM